MERLSKILVVDDELQIQFLLEEFLTSLGHTVRLAGDGEQALRLLQTEAFDGVSLISGQVAAQVGICCGWVG
jgi:CheY-like chemotaxis protein